MNQKNNMGRFFLEAGRSDESQRIERFTCILQNYVSDLDINIRHIKYHITLRIVSSITISNSCMALEYAVSYFHILNTAFRL